MLRRILRVYMIGFTLLLPHHDSVQYDASHYGGYVATRNLRRREKMEAMEVERFARDHGGVDGIRRFVEACNSNLTLEEIGKLFSLSASQVCRLRDKLLQRIWVMKPATMEYIEFVSRVEQRAVNEKKEFVASHLRLLGGGKE